MPHGQMENLERDAMLEEISGSSRSYQRNMELTHGNVELPVPSTPGYIAQTPSIQETRNWFLIHS